MGNWDTLSWKNWWVEN